MASIFDLMLANKVSRDTTASDEVVAGAKTAKELRSMDLNNRIKQQSINSNDREMQEFDANAGLRDLQRTAATEALSPERRQMAQDQQSATSQALTLSERIKRYEAIQENLGPEKAVEAMHKDKFLPEDAQLEYTKGEDGNEYAAIRFPSQGNKVQILGATKRAQIDANLAGASKARADAASERTKQDYKMELERLKQAGSLDRTKINAASRDRAAALRASISRDKKTNQPKRSLNIGIKEVYPMVESRLLTTMPDMASILDTKDLSSEEASLKAQFQDLQDRVAITVSELAGTEPVTDSMIDAAIEQVLENTEPVETAIPQGFFKDAKIVTTRKAVPATKAASAKQESPQDIAKRLGLTGKIKSGKMNGKIVFQLENGSVVDANGKPVSVRSSTGIN